MAELNTSQVLNVNITNEDIDSNSIWEVFDKKLCHALESKSNSIVLFLKKELGYDDIFLNWIKRWYDKFSEYGKDIRFVSEYENQIQALSQLKLLKSEKKESSIQELENVYLLMKPGDESPLSMRNTFEKTDMMNSMIEKKSEFTFPCVYIGEITSISGEYRCLSCGHFEHFIGGTKMIACTHTDCQSPEKGWQLLIGIF